MKAVCWYGNHDIRVTEVPDPRLINPRDAILKVTATAICGSDLHLYNGIIPSMQRGDILEHEFMGEVKPQNHPLREKKTGDKADIWQPFPRVPSAHPSSGRCAFSFARGTSVRNRDKPRRPNRSPRLRVPARSESAD
jgi:hypothetical protein